MDQLNPKEFERWARIGVDQDGVKYIPVAGICMMTYLISKQDDKLLVGKISGDKHADYWRESMGMYVHRRFIWEDKWFVPSGFLHFGESPLDSAKRLLRDMLQAKSESVELSTVVSFVTPSRYYPNYHHWHVCFIYDVQDLRLKGKPDWFDKLEYVSIGRLDLENIAVEGSTVLKKLLGPASRAATGRNTSSG